MELRETNFADIEQEWAFVRDMPEDEFMARCFTRGF